MENRASRTRWLNIYVPAVAWQMGLLAAIGGLCIGLDQRHRRRAAMAARAFRNDAQRSKHAPKKSLVTANVSEAKIKNPIDDFDIDRAPAI